MKVSSTISIVIAIALMFVITTAAFAQEMTPNVQVAGTGVVDGTVTIVEATIDGPGWVVIHADNNGSPGPVIGYAPLEEGVNSDVVVEIDAEAATPILHAMLHVDEGEVGTYEFPGADVPVKIDDDIVMAEFSAAPVVEAEEAMAPETMPMTGASTSVPFVLAIAALGFAALGANVVVTRRRA